jgi:hypothetical protein
MMKMKPAISDVLTGVAVCVFSVTLHTAAHAAETAVAKPLPATGWHELDRIHVRDSAEKDLAVLKGGDGTVEVRLCAERNAVRLRNAELWMAGDKRQKLWLPLILEAGKCSNPIAVNGGPIRVTHVALEYEAMSLGSEGAHVSIQGRTKSLR